MQQVISVIEKGLVDKFGHVSIESEEELGFLSTCCQKDFVVVDG